MEGFGKPGKVAEVALSGSMVVDKLWSKVYARSAASVWFVVLTKAEHLVYYRQELRKFRISGINPFTL